MTNIFLKATDDFICKNMKNIFENLEKTYTKRNEKINLFEELRNLKMNPFALTPNKSTSFEKELKHKLKIVIGIFFVSIPLVLLLTLTYINQLDYVYPIALTFAIAIFASSRTEKIADRYSHFRHTH